MDKRDLDTTADDCRNKKMKIDNHPSQSHEESASDSGLSGGTGSGTGANFESESGRCSLPGGPDTAQSNSTDNPSGVSANVTAKEDGNHGVVDTHTRMTATGTTGKTSACSQTKRPEPMPGRCQFFLDRKRRYCKAPQPKGRIYCIEHSHLLGDESVRKRIKCPLDPKHSCYEDQLQNHLKKCNASKGAQAVYYVENINSGSDEGEDTEQNKVGIRDVDETVVLQLADRVRQLHKEHVQEISSEVLFHPVLQEMADKPDNGPSAQKHIKQQASLVGHMHKLDLLDDWTNFIEFGAGKGGLSHWVQLSVKDCTDTGFLLIDKGSVRYKMDSYHKGTDQGPSFERMKIDIQHLHLGKVSSLCDSSRSTVAIGKHLCGGATDLMLRCLMETLGKDTLSHSQLKGLVLAFCCHHRCDWKTYVGKHFMRQCGVRAKDFQLMCSMSSWATCGTRHVESSTDAKDEAGQQADDGSGAGTEYNHPRYGSLTPQERERIGNQCKQLIDHGRICYLLDRGLHARMAFYIEKSHSLENVVLLAKSTGSESTNS